MREARFYESKGKTVICKLCPRNCIIKEGNTGFCGVRKNINGKLYSLVYGKLVAANVDPIEKKPLFHFMPGTLTFSIATYGCNLRCKFCQNWSISQRTNGYSEEWSAEQVVEYAIKYECKSVSYTYTEPTIFYEFAYDCSKLAKKENLANIFVTNGYMSEEALKEISKYLDAMNIDLKFFDSKIYKELCAVPDNTPILNNIKLAYELGIHVEVTNLIIPGYNDKEEMIRDMCRFLVNEVSSEIPLHFTRFYPHYKMLDVPPTPVKTLEKAREIAIEEGMKYVYIGNVPGHEAENTYCPNCGKLLIRRWGFEILEYNIERGRCKFCGEKIFGRFLK